jgi:hypothetical protein
LILCSIVGLSAGCGSETSVPDASQGTDTRPSDAIAPLADASADAGASEDAAADDAAAPRDTWATFARDFTATYCVPCHGAGNMQRDYTLYMDVYRDRAEIRCGVAPAPAPSGCNGFPPPEQFPVGNGAKPSSVERARFVAWIDDGAPE